MASAVANFFELLRTTANERIQRRRYHRPGLAKRAGFGAALWPPFSGIHWAGSSAVQAKLRAAAQSNPCPQLASDRDNFASRSVPVQSGCDNATACPIML
jgi:hypothetical protein